MPSSKRHAQNYQFDSVRSEGETHLLLNIMEDVDTFLDMQKYCDTDFIEKASRASKGVRILLINHMAARKWEYWWNIHFHASFEEITAFLGYGQKIWNIVCVRV